MATSPAGRPSHGTTTWPGKLRPPPLPDGHVPRPRLVERIIAGLDETGLVMLMAGDGFGKTTILVETYHSLKARGPTAWLSLDSRDDDPGAVLIGLIEATAAAVPGLGADALVAANQSTPHGVALGFSLLVGDLEHLDEPVTLIVDDLDTLANPDVHEAARRLTRYRPPGLRVVLASRDERIIDPDRARHAQPVQVLGASDLALSSAETKAVVMGRRGAVGDREADDLHDATGGWVAGVVLSSLGADDEDPTVFDTRRLPVAQFLRRATLGWIDDRLGRFLLDICVLEHVTPALARAATRAEDPAGMLEELQRRHILDPPTSPVGPTWVVPRIVRDFGRHELAQQDPERATVLLLRAARHHLREGQLATGVNVAMRSDDPMGAAMVLLRVHLALSTSGRGAVVHDLATTLIRNGLALPELHLAAGWGAMSAGRDDQAWTEVRAAEGPRTAGQRGRFIRAEAHGLRSHLHRRRGQFTQAVAAVSAARSVLAETEPDAEWGYADSVRTRLWLDDGMASFVAGDLDVAVEAFQRVTGGELPGPMRAIAHSYLALIAWLEGQNDPASHGQLGKVLERRRSDEPDLAHFITALVAALTCVDDEGATAMRHAELIAHSIPEPGMDVLIRLARAHRIGQSWPIADAPVDLLPPGVDHHDPRALLADARGVMSGMPETGVLPRVLERVRAGLGESPDAKAFGEPLTDGESKVLGLLSTSLSEREIAAQLHLSHNTVRTYRRRLYRKLGVTSRQAAVTAAASVDR